MRQVVFLLAVLVLMASPSLNGAGAQNVLSDFDPERAIELSSTNGPTRVNGELVRVEDGFFVVRTELGELRISVDSVTCNGPGCPAKADNTGFLIHVAKDIGPALLPELLRDYATQTGAEIEVLEAEREDQQVVRLSNAADGTSTEIGFYTGTSGFLALINDNAQIALQDVSLVDEVGSIMPQETALELSSRENQKLIAQDAVIVAVNEANPVRNLSRSEIAGIFSGEISNWLELGGGNLPISLYGLGGNTVRGTQFLRFFMDNPDELSSAASLFDHDEDVRNALRNDEGGIGFLSRARTQDTKPIALRESCGLVTATDNFTIKTDGYPLTNAVYAYRNPVAIDPRAQDLLDWMSSRGAQAAIRRAGFVDTGIERTTLEDMGMMLIHTAAVEPDFSPAQYSEMLRVLRDAERLSLSFRFEPASADLDDASKRELELLGARMEAGEFAGLELLLVGFADSTGPAEVNTRIAAERAEAVRGILVEAVSPETTSRLRMRPLSFGEMLPLACNDEEIGRDSNRRVEIWVRRLGVRSN